MASLASLRLVRTDLSCAASLSFSDCGGAGCSRHLCRPALDTVVKVFTRARAEGRTRQASLERRQLAGILRP